MTSRLRFTAARQILDAFAPAAGDFSTPPADEPPLHFLRKLARSEAPAEALLFGAYVLPRREAVWWGCECVRAILGAAAADPALEAAEAWVRAPEEAARRAALALGQAGDPKRATTWLAFAAGWSGGDISGAERKPFIPDRPDILPPPANAAPHMTAKAVYAALELAMAAAGANRRDAWIAACADACARFAEGGDAKVLEPSRGANASNAS